MLTLVERVLLLSEVAVFRHVRTEDLAHVASAAREDEMGRGDVIYASGETPEALHVVVSGRVRLQKPGGQPVDAGPRTAFGAWALFDHAPRLFTATAAEPCKLLSLAREPFLDVLSDHVRVVEGMLEVLASRSRAAVLAQSAGDAREEILIG